jgi:hypothetical protein
MIDDRNAMIEEIIEKFNFEKVLIAMTALDWQWQTTAGNGHSLPTLQRLKAMARHLLNESIKETVVGSGGFEAKYHPKVNSDTEYFELKFILCHEDSYDD